MLWETLKVTETEVSCVSMRLFCATGEKPLPIPLCLLIQDLLRLCAVPQWQGNVRIEKPFCQKARQEEHNFKFQSVLQQPVWRCETAPQSLVLKQESCLPRWCSCCPANTGASWARENIEPPVNTVISRATNSSVDAAFQWKRWSCRSWKIHSAKVQRANLSWAPRRGRQGSGRAWHCTHMRCLNKNVPWG